MHVGSKLPQLGPGAGRTALTACRASRAGRKPTLEAGDVTPNISGVGIGCKSGCSRESQCGKAGKIFWRGSPPGSSSAPAGTRARASCAASTLALAALQTFRQAFGGGSQNDKRTIKSIKSGILNTSTVQPQVLAHRSCVEAAPWRVSAGKTWSGARREPRRACMPSPGPAASVNASQMGVMCSVLLPQAHVLRAGPGAGRAGFPGR